MFLLSSPLLFLLWKTSKYVTFSSLIQDWVLLTNCNTFNNRYKRFTCHKVEGCVPKIVHISRRGSLEESLAKSGLLLIEMHIIKTSNFFTLFWLYFAILSLETENMFVIVLTNITLALSDWLDGSQNLWEDDLIGSQKCCERCIAVA